MTEERQGQTRQRQALAREPEEAAIAGEGRWLGEATQGADPSGLVWGWSGAALLGSPPPPPPQQNNPPGLRGLTS